MARKIVSGSSFDRSFDKTFLSRKVLLRMSSQYPDMDRVGGYGNWQALQRKGEEREERRKNRPKGLPVSDEEKRHPDMRGAVQKALERSLWGC